MPDGSKWDVPAEIIVTSRAKYYAELDAARGDGSYETLFNNELKYALADPGLIKEWAENNMNWSDVSATATRWMAPVPEDVDYQDGWVNGRKEIVDL
jgi:hypothetical protein